jgi:hypothetical protein
MISPSNHEQTVFRPYYKKLLYLFLVSIKDKLSPPNIISIHPKFQKL